MSCETYLSSTFKIYAANNGLYVGGREHLVKNRRRIEKIQKIMENTKTFRCLTGINFHGNLSIQQKTATL